MGRFLEYSIATASLRVAISSKMPSAHFGVVLSAIDQDCEPRLVAPFHGIRLVRPYPHLRMYPTHGVRGTGSRSAALPQRFVPLTSPLATSVSRSRS